MVSWGKTAPDEIFAPNASSDIYASVVSVALLDAASYRTPRPAQDWGQAMHASAWEAKWGRSSNGRSSVVKKLSDKALAQASPANPIDGHSL